MQRAAAASQADATRWEDVVVDRGAAETQANRDGWLLQSRVPAEFGGLSESIVDIGEDQKVSGQKLGSGILYCKTSKEEKRDPVVLLVAVRFQTVFDTPMARVIKMPSS